MLPKLSSRPASLPAGLLSGTTRIDPGLRSAESLSGPCVAVSVGVPKSLIIGSIRREFLDHMVIFNERHLRRVLSLYVDQCGSSGEPFVAMMQSADLRYGGDTSLLLREYESDAGTPRKSPLLRANLDEGRRCPHPARIRREAPPLARVTARRSVRQFQTERRAADRWLLRHPIGRSTQTSQADHVGHVEAAVRDVGGRSDETIITGGQRDSGASICKIASKENVGLPLSPAYLRRKSAAGTQSVQASK